MNGHAQARTTAIIADDEPRLAAYLRDRLAVLWPELVIAGIAGNGPEAQALIDAEAPDIAFLDIRMPGLSGLEVARGAGAHVHIVFVTAFDQYAVDAFERAAVDYLLKPVTDERLAETVARLKQRLAAAPPAPRSVGDAVRAGAARAAARRGRRRRAARLGPRVDGRAGAPHRDRRRLLLPGQRQVHERLHGGRRSADPHAAPELAEQLDPARFWQVHRGTIVNVRAHRDDDARPCRPRDAGAEDASGAVAVSRAFAHRFKQM